MKIIGMGGDGSELREQNINVAPTLVCTKCKARQRAENKDGVYVFTDKLLSYSLKPAKGAIKRFPGLYCSVECFKASH